MSAKLRRHGGRLVLWLLLLVLSASVAAGVHTRLRRQQLDLPGLQFRIGEIWLTIDRSFARFALLLSEYAIFFAAASFLTSLFVHRRTAEPLVGLLTRDGPILLLLSPTVGALMAFGPTDTRPRYLNMIALVYIAAAAWKIWPMVRAEMLHSERTRTRDVFALALTILLALSLLDHPRSLDGDEPHYLVMAHSLLHDADLELSNDYNPLTARYYADGFLDTHTTVVLDAKTGRTLQRPTHYPGLALLVAPGLAVGGAVGAKLAIALCGAAALAGIYAMLRRLRIGPQAAIWAVCAAGLSCPLATYSLQIYPEITAAAFATWSVTLLLREDLRIRHALTIGIMAAALPWLQIRFAPLSAAFMIAAIWRLRQNPLGIALVLAPVGLSAVGIASYWLWLYGELRPGLDFAAPVGGHGFDFSIQSAMRDLCSLFLDARAGIVAYAPALLLAPAGAILLWKRNRFACLTVVGIVGAEAVAIAAGNRPWYGGWCPPGRYMVCVAPLLAAVAVVAYESCANDRVLRAISRVLIACGVLMSLLMLVNPESMYSDHAPGLLPAITMSYRFIRLNWFFPYSTDSTLRICLLGLMHAAIVCVVTARCLRAEQDGRACQRGAVCTQ